MLKALPIPKADNQDPYCIFKKVWSTQLKCLYYIIYEFVEY